MRPFGQEALLLTRKPHRYRHAKLIKRYARSRLYDTEAACCVTLSDLREWQLRGLAFTVIDAETRQHITSVLLA